MSWQQSGNFLAMVILGSSGTLIGPIFGAAIFTSFQQIVSDLSSHWLFYFGLLIVLRILLFKRSIFHFLAAEEPGARVKEQSIEKRSAAIEQAPVVEAEVKP